MRNHDNNNHVIAALLNAGAAISISIFLAARGGDSNKTSGGSVEDQEVFAITDKTVSGVSQKGPFVNGSSITVQELDGATLAQTGLGFEGKIKNDLGEFSIKVKSLQSQYALLKANGFYRNEVTGEKSKSQVTLYALTDLSNRDEVNVNLLTHLEYERSLYLAADDSLSVAFAKKQAESEVLASFGIKGEFANAEDLSIFGNGDENAALLAISVLMQGELSEADFSERLNNYATDIEIDGKWDDAKTATKIADWASENSLNGGLSKIRRNIVDWDLASDVPAFEKYVDNFWWENYGLGACNDRREGEVLKNGNSLSGKYDIYFICEKNVWRIASDTEYDTYLQKCEEDGKIIFGNVNKKFAYDCDVEIWRHATDVETALGGCIEMRFEEVAETGNIHYICQKREWRKATDIEKDTYKWKDGKDADSKYGDVVKTNCYVYEDSSWRSGNKSDCALDLRGCTMLRQDTVGKGSDRVWYICDTKNWRNATTYEKDTFGWKDSTDGAIKKGNVTDAIYVFDKTAWRTTSNVEAKLGGCVSAIADSVGKAGSTYYICKSNAWVEASAIEYDTYRWSAGQDGEVRAGQVNKTIYYIFETSNNAWRNATTYEKDTYGWNKEENATVRKGNVSDTFYVYENEIFRIANAREVYIKEGCTDYNEGSINVKSDTSDYVCKQGVWQIHKNVLIDERDGQSYQTVRIGSQVWMAQDLNYADSIKTENLKGASWCGYWYGDRQGWGYEECDYRVYYWNAAMDVPSEYQEEKYNGENKKGICPNGWHLPSKEEWNTLINFAGGEREAGFRLKDWGDACNQSVDVYGFSAQLSESGRFYPDDTCLPDDCMDCETTHDGYCRNSDKIWFALMGGAYYWTLSQSDASRAIVINIPYCDDYNDYKKVLQFDWKKNNVLSVRCVKDEE